MSERKAPHKVLGEHLRFVREQSNKSLGEVSAAIEIDELRLGNIEDGHELPEEDILSLLVTHYELNPAEALQVWELAGYDGVPDHVFEMLPKDLPEGAKSVVIMASDPRAIYTDGVEISWTETGLNMSFTQAGKEKPMVVSKVGMSFEQAERVYQVLQAALLRAKYQRGPKKLPNGDQNKT